VLFSGIWLGILWEMARQMGSLLCILDLPIRWINTGCMAVPYCLSPTTTSGKAEESLKSLH